VHTTVDIILLFLGGMICGGYVFVKGEPFVNKHISRHGSFIFSSWGVMRYIGILLVVVSYFFLHLHFITGMGTGMIIFSLAPAAKN